MTKTSIYDEVTDSIIEQLKQGSAPWVQPWTTTGQPPSMPANATTNNFYSGINILLLWASAAQQDFTQGQWVTYKQAQAIGGQVKKGAKGTRVVFASTFTPKTETIDAAIQGRDAKSFNFLKRYTVFNIAQCDGLKADTPEKAMPHDTAQKIQHYDEIIKATGADFRIGGDEAFYDAEQDFIRTPDPRAFEDQINWYRTAFHELGHWTMHSSRCDRAKSKFDGLRALAFEELIAELCAAFCCAHLGIKPTVRHSDYIATWLKALQNDNKFIFRAASQASKAANFILKNTDTNQQAAA